MKVTSLIVGTLFMSLSLSANCSSTQNQIKEYIQSKKASSSHNIKDQRDIASFKRDIRMFQRELTAQNRGLNDLLNGSKSIQTCYLQY